MRYPRILLPIIFLLLFFTQAVAQETKKVVATIDPDGTQRVSVTGGEYFFDPNHIVVKVNVPVELKITKESGVTPHDIILKAPEAGIDFTEDIGTTPKVIKFTPTKTGTYPFFCDKKFLMFKSHRERGMEGKLEVVE